MNAQLVEMDLKYCYWANQERSHTDMEQNIEGKEGSWKLESHKNAHAFVKKQLNVSIKKT